MKKYTILVPYDFTEESVNALNHAVKLASLRPTEINVLHVVSAGNDGTFSTQGPALSSDPADAAMITYIERINKRLDKEMNAHDGRDFIQATNVKVAADEKTVEDIILGQPADLIVMGTHGFHAGEEIFVSSIAEQVADKAKVPVMVVKKNTPVTNYDSIVYASHFEHEVEQEAHAIRGFLDGMETNVQLLKIIGEDEKASADEISKLLMVQKAIEGKSSLGDNSIINAKNREEALDHYMLNSNSDVLAMHAENLTGVSRLFKNAIVEKVVNTMKKPVLLLHKN